MGCTVKLIAPSMGSFHVATIRGFTLMLLNGGLMYRNEVPLRNAIVGKSKQEYKWMVLRGCFGSMGLAFGFLALSELPLGDANTIIFLAPVFSGIFGYLILGEPWRLIDFMFTCLSFVGIILVVRPSFLFGTENDAGLSVVGVVAGLIAALGAGLVFVIIRKLKLEYNTHTLVTIHQLAFFGTILCPIFAVIFGQSFQGPDHGWKYALLPVMAICGTIGQLMMTKGMTMCKSAPGSAMRTIDVPFAYLYQIFVFEESPTLWSITGAILVLTSVIAIVVFRDKEENTQQKNNIEISTYNGVAGEEVDEEVAL
jgi:drug/metabolite transporter (DMT)-like permease